MKSNAARLEVIKAAGERRRQMNYERTGMLSLDVLPDEPIPAGSYLVHNHVRPQKPLNGNGFRAWIQTSADAGSAAARTPRFTRSITALIAAIRRACQVLIACRRPPDTSRAHLDGPLSRGWRGRD